MCKILFSVAVQASCARIGNKLVLVFIMHLLQNLPGNRGMIILCDIKSLENCPCGNVIRQCLQKLSQRRIG